MLEAAAIFLAMAAYGALHSLLAASGPKRWALARFGPRANRAYRLTYNAVALVSFMPVLALLAWYPGEVLYRIALPWLALALAGQGVSMVLLAIGLLQTDTLSFLGFRQLADGESSVPPSLTVTGLYRWVRHPLYTAGLVLIWLTPVMTTGVLALNLALTGYIALGYRLEERRLVAEFGRAYVEYQARVPALIPRLPPASMSKAG
jgi:protein-S-isoprenylcysteine O-methyltransferase Ste14